MTKDHIKKGNIEECQESRRFIPDHDELLLIAKYWWKERLAIDWFYFNTGCTGGYECRLSRFAGGRIGQIIDMLGSEAVKQAIDEATAEYRDQQGQDLKLWQIFRHGDKTQWNRVQEEYERITCLWKPGEPKWAYAPKMVLTSSAFNEAASIPSRYASDGEDISPPLSWNKPPKGTSSMVITMCDLDGSSVFTHWIIFNIPCDCRELKEGVPHKKQLPDGALQGENEYRKIGYSGPGPTAPFHRYQFSIYALDRHLELAAGISRSQLLDAMEGHILDEGHLTAIYKLPL